MRTTTKTTKSTKTNKTANYTKVCSNCYKLGNSYRVSVKGTNKYFTKRSEALACRKALLGKNA